MISIIRSDLVGITQRYFVDIGTAQLSRFSHDYCACQQFHDMPLFKMFFFYTWHFFVQGIFEICLFKLYTRYLKIKENRIKIKAAFLLTSQCTKYTKFSLKKTIFQPSGVFQEVFIKRKSIRCIPSTLWWSVN